MNKIFLNGTITQKHRLSDGKRLAITLMPLNDKTGKGAFIKVIAFDPFAKTLENLLEKGMRIGVEGHLSNYVVEIDGKKQYRQDAVIEYFEFLEKKAKEAEEPVKEANQEE